MKVVHHILVKAVVSRPPKSTLRLKRWMEKLLGDSKALSGPHVFQTREDCFAAFVVKDQTHCAVHISGSEFQVDLFTPEKIDADEFIKKMGEFEVGDHEVLLVDRTGEFQILISRVTGMF